jgi:branched-chain amino acid transport system permease protein
MQPSLPTPPPSSRLSALDSGHFPLPRQHTGLLGTVAIAIAITVFGGALNAYYLDVAMNVGIAIILGVSLNLVNGHTGQFSLGHAGFMAVGAYFSSACTLRLIDSAHSPFAQQALFLGALLLGGLIAALAGFLIGLPSLRLKGDYLALITLGFAEIIRVLFQNTPALGGAIGLNGMPPLTSIAWTFGWVALTVFTISCLINSTYGRGFLAVRDDEIAASASGINPTRYKVVAFTLAAFFAGIAGGLFAHLKLAIDPRGFDFYRSVEIVVIVILGGMGNTLGVILAAILLTLLPEFLRPVAEYRMVLYAALIIGLMLVRPQGLLNLRFSKQSRV